MYQKGLFSEMMRNYKPEDDEVDIYVDSNACQTFPEPDNIDQEHVLQNRRQMHRFTSLVQVSQSSTRKRTMTTEERYKGVVSQTNYVALVHAAGGWYVPIFILGTMITTQVARVM